MLQQAGLAPMRVCIFSPEEESCEILALDSQEAGYRVEQTFNEQKRLVDFISSSSIDHIVLIDARQRHDEGLKLIRQICAGRPVAMVAISKTADFGPGSPAMEAGAQALLIDPVNSRTICAAFAQAIHQQARQARLECEIHQLREKLAQRKLIEKAKGILMEAAKVTEAEAFRLIQKQSQDHRKSMAEIAMSIISATQLVEEARRIEPPIQQA